MDGPNQGREDELERLTFPAPLEPLPPYEPQAWEVPPHRPSLLPWLVIVTVAGVGGLLVGQAELALLAVLGGLFAVAHAADLDATRDFAYRALAWIVPAGSVVLFAGLGVIVWKSDLARGPRLVGVVTSAVGALFSVATSSRPVAHDMVRTLFGQSDSSRVSRLAARLAVLATLLCLPAGLAFPLATEQLAGQGATLVGGAAALWGNLVGLVLLAMGGVGLWVRRGLVETLERLGLVPIRWTDAIVIIFGVIAMVGVNGGAEWIQRRWFLPLWTHDQHVNEMIAGGLTRSETLLLGLSAGFGEELALRGALQPRLGVFRTSVLFALLHVQYSWFGMALIAVLGLLLGTIRQRTSTSVAIAVHTLYDVAAVLAVTAAGRT
jgi:hypothetical protein